jgi:hypothetical protein
MPVLLLQGLIRADGFKILYGNVIENTWTGPFYPNKTTAWCDTCPLDCGPASVSVQGPFTCVCKAVSVVCYCGQNMRWGDFICSVCQ